MACLLFDENGGFNCSPPRCSGCEIALYLPVSLELHEQWDYLNELGASLIEDGNYNLHFWVTHNQCVFVFMHLLDLIRRFRPVAFKTRLAIHSEFTKYSRGNSLFDFSQDIKETALLDMLSVFSNNSGYFENTKKFIKRRNELMHANSTFHLLNDDFVILERNTNSYLKSLQSIHSEIWVELAKIGKVKQLKQNYHEFVAIYGADNRYTWLGENKLSPKDLNKVFRYC